MSICVFRLGMMVEPLPIDDIIYSLLSVLSIRFIESMVAFSCAVSH